MVSSSFSVVENLDYRSSTSFSCVVWSVSFSWVTVFEVSYSFETCNSNSSMWGIYSLSESAHLISSFNCDLNSCSFSSLTFWIWVACSSASLTLTSTSFFSMVASCWDSTRVSFTSVRVDSSSEILNSASRWLVSKSSSTVESFVSVYYNTTFDCSSSVSFYLRDLSDLVILDWISAICFTKVSFSTYTPYSSVWDFVRELISCFISAIMDLLEDSYSSYWLIVFSEFSSIYFMLSLSY